MELTTSFVCFIVCYKLFMMSKIQNLNGTHNFICTSWYNTLLFMMSKIQNLNGTHNYFFLYNVSNMLFMMSKIQNLNGTHNTTLQRYNREQVVYDVKDTKFEWNSQHLFACPIRLYRCL